MNPNANRSIPLESQEQKTLFDWAEYMSSTYPELELLYHIPNGGKRNKAEAARLKSEGVKAGVPDLCLPVPRMGYHGLYIEMKRLRGGKTSESQDKWIERLQKQGYLAIVCNGWECASKKIMMYLSGDGGKKNVNSRDQTRKL